MTDAATVLVVMALQQESQGVFESAGIKVLYTGLGKVNATLSLTQQLTMLRLAGKPLPLVVNFGTAGSRVVNTGALVSCTRFIQRDMDVSALGFARSVTPFETTPAQLTIDNVFPEYPAASCGTGDSFETGIPAIATDVVDMEAYALAKVCQHHGAQFVCVKYISDGADHAAAQDWQANAHKAANEFLWLYHVLQQMQNAI